MNAKAQSPPKSGDPAHQMWLDSGKTVGSGLVTAATLFDVCLDLGHRRYHLRDRRLDLSARPTDVGFTLSKREENYDGNSESTTSD